MGAIQRTHALEDASQVRFYRWYADAERGRNLFIGGAFAQQFQDLVFSPGKSAALPNISLRPVHARQADALVQAALRDIQH